VRDEPAAVDAFGFEFEFGCLVWWWFGGVDVLVVKTRANTTRQAPTQ
jgi:hypothetical protein